MNNYMYHRPDRQVFLLCFWIGTLFNLNTTFTTYAFHCLCKKMICPVSKISLPPKSVATKRLLSSTDFFKLTDGNKHFGNVTKNPNKYYGKCGKSEVSEVSEG